MAVEVYISEEKINQRLDELATKINEDYKGQEITILSVLSGAFIFTADLIRRINVPLTVQFISAKSYQGNKSTGDVTFDFAGKGDLKDRHVLVIEDIVDTGLTLSKLFHILKKEHPASLKLCTLLSKPVNTVHYTQIDYEGFEIEDKFVIGYGLDYDGKYRELPYIGIYSED